MKKLWLRFRLVFPLGKEKLLEDNAHEQRYVETIKGYLKETEANWFLYFQSELEKMDEPDDGACIDPLLRSINVTNAISPKAIMASYVHIITLLGQAYRNSADLAIRKQFRTLQSSIMRNYLTLSHDKYGDNKFTLSDGQVLEVTAALQEAENFKGNLSISESFRNRIRPAMGNRAYKNSILQYKLPARANFSISDFAIQGNDIEARKNQAVRLLSSKINDLLFESILLFNFFED